MILTKILSPFFFIALRIISVFVYLFTILAAFGGRVNPDYFAFPSILCLAFPFFAFATIILAVIWAICRKIFFCGLAIATIVICLTPMSSAFPLAGSRSPSPAQGQTFKIISWNILHGQDIRKPEYEGNRSIEFLINSGADIIGLAELRDFNNTEIHNFSDSLKDSLFSIYPYRAGKPGTFIQLLSKYPVERLDKLGYDRNGICCFDFFKVSFPQNELIVCMVHLYSYGLSDQERQVVTEINSMQTAKESMSELKGSIRSKMKDAFRYRSEDATILRENIDDIALDIPLIVCGDFNDVPASWTYNLVRGDDLRDAYAETNFGPAITYNLHAFYFHIDQMLYRGPIEALNLSVHKINSSDHYPLIAEFQFLNPN